ncbi:MAG: YgjP-like metallopeptidase domain-containing protein [Candidatus Nanoarchaeia archaeon]
MLTSLFSKKQKKNINSYEENNVSNSTSLKDSSNNSSQSIIENKLSQEFNVSVSIIYCDKKHSSGSIKNNSIILRISNRLKKTTQHQHAYELAKKLSKILQTQPERFNQKHIKTQYFLKAIEQGYCYVNNYKIILTLNSTKTTIKKEKQTINRKPPVTLLNIENIVSHSNSISNSTDINKESDDNNSIIISIPNKNYSQLDIKEVEKIERKVAKLLCSEFNYLLKKKVHELNSQTLQSKLQDIYFDYTSSKWGHCSYHNNIMIHISLLNSPQEVFEYVIYHELAHTIVKNHSSKYWKVCNSLTPHTKFAKHYLKKNPPILWQLEK